MNYTVIIDWKFVVALGAVPTGIILASKINPEAAERVLMHVIDTYKGSATPAIVSARN